MFFVPGGRTRVVVYTVHESPKPLADPLERAARLVFINDRFHWLAAIFPAIWLLVKRMWWELVAYLVLISALIGVLDVLGATPAAVSIIVVIVQIVFGFEAGALYRASLARRGWRMLGTVAARNTVECERRFFEAWLPQLPSAPLSDIPATAANDGVSPWIATASSHAKNAFGRWLRMLGAKA
ncbi:MAG: DUF2628 domain-containing protein [Hyphomicrobium sp.]